MRYKNFKEENGEKKYVVVVVESKFFDHEFPFLVDDDLTKEYPDLVFSGEYSSRRTKEDKEIEYLFYYI